MHLRQLAAQDQIASLAAQAQVVIESTDDIAVLLEVAGIVYSAGLLTLAKQALCQVETLQPQDVRYRITLANVYREAGKHPLALNLYRQLMQVDASNLLFQRNYLTSLEYDLHSSDQLRFAAACDWGKLAVSAVGGVRVRPRLSPLNARPLRIGYVSADLCQHTVGWLLLPVIQRHSDRVRVYTYHAGQQVDHLTEQMKARTHYRAVHGLTDQALVAKIKADEIDVLIDLSGHTGGSRLSVFAHRPAPVQVSWLGYFATTGLSTMDAVLLDEAHACADTPAAFVEKLRYLPSRWCYQPVPFAPMVAAAPHHRNGYITFGSFNNTAKYNQTVFEVWARILQAVPHSRLILKWRSFHDTALKQETWRFFQQHGIEATRIVLRPASFHVDLLSEYADMDIALDPFPFTGGMTSLEALWMGVPVITYPMQRVVSRQTHAVLQQIGLSSLSATSLADYVGIAVRLAHAPDELDRLRKTMRQNMQSSDLMNAKRVTDSLERCLLNLYQQYYEEQDKVNTININNKEYAVAALSDHAQQQISSIQVVDAELAKLQQQVAIYQTARHAYVQALVAEVESAPAAVKKKPAARKAKS